MIENYTSPLECEAVADIFESFPGKIENEIENILYHEYNVSIVNEIKNTIENVKDNLMEISGNLIEGASISSKLLTRHIPFSGLNPLKYRAFPKGTSDRDIVKSVVENRERDEPFFIVNLSKVEQQVKYMRELLPRVDIFYAVKCNSNKRIIEKLNSMGVSFDCASRGEMKLVEKTLGIKPDERPKYFGNNVIFANPCKQISHIRYAKEIGVKMIVVDGLNEMVKMAKHYPEADIVIRIKVEDKNSKYAFSSKFGAALEDCPKMLQFAVENKLNIVGVSFHVGSGCGDATQYIGALERARTLFNMAEEYGYKMNLLDIGGGFPGTENGDITFRQIADILREPLDKLFDPANVRVIAEPGRYIATQSHILLCNVFSRKEKISSENTKLVYYVNDSIYGSFSCIIADGATPIINIYNKEDVCIPTFESDVYGCTCDSIDIIFKDIQLPILEEGTWLYFYDFGAYTKSCSSSFNGFSTSNFVYVEYE